MNTQYFSHVAEYGRDGVLGQCLVVLCLQPHFRHDVLGGDEQMVCTAMVQLTASVHSQ